MLVSWPHLFLSRLSMALALACSLDVFVCGFLWPPSRNESRAWTMLHVCPVTVKDFAEFTFPLSGTKRRQSLLHSKCARVICAVCTWRDSVLLKMWRKIWIFVVVNSSSGKLWIFHHCKVFASLGQWGWISEFSNHLFSVLGYLYTFRDFKMCCRQFILCYLRGIQNVHRECAVIFYQAFAWSVRSFLFCCEKVLLFIREHMLLCIIESFISLMVGMLSWKMDRWQVTYRMYLVTNFEQADKQLSCKIVYWEMECYIYTVQVSLEVPEMCCYQREIESTLAARMLSTVHLNAFTVSTNLVSLARPKLSFNDRSSLLAVTALNVRSTIFFSLKHAAYYWEWNCYQWTIPRATNHSTLSCLSWFISLNACL